MHIPYPFPYQGSKRKLAAYIVSLIPGDTENLVEPFAGAAAVSIAAAQAQKANTFVLNDINAPLMALWKRILDAPEDLAEQYQRIWEAQHGREKEYYFEIRDEFNRTHRPELLLFLLVRCVKAAVRYNARGEFNQAADNRRKGTRPARMRQQILATSCLLHGKTTIRAADYREVITAASPADVIYMDPPYQGVCGNRDPRYYESLEFEAFVDELARLNRHGIRYLVSYDGRTGSKTHGKTLPARLALHRLEINAGRSSQATLLGRRAVTYESLYLSPALYAQVADTADHLFDHSEPYQLKLPL
jgi:DNA adenine methylase